jgi:arylsulfatase
LSGKPASRPNIILILADDMGYSDIGCYGGEIHTPTLDKLAEEGLKYTKFYNTSRCCPSRASLMTGLYPHQAGMGWMASIPHEEPGYVAELNNHCVTIAEVLKGAGYATYMTGKWHLCKREDAVTANIGDDKKYDWPVQRGFDKFYGILLGAANYYDPGALCRDNRLISPYKDTAYAPKQYYFTDAISDNSVKYIKERDKKKPFFMYVAYTAAHWPMQAPESAIQKYKGRYDQGYETIRRQRYERMQRLGLIKKGMTLSPPDAEATPSWTNEKDKPAMARRMETYAAMVDVMDQGIGRIVKELKKEGLYDNTVLVFLQDNGACHEIVGSGVESFLAKDTTKVQHLTRGSIQYSQNPPITRDGKWVRQGKEVMAGPADTYVSYLRQWANVSNTPFRMYKHWVYEGGISTPLIIHWPAGIKDKGGMRDAPGHEIDIMPTLVSLAHAEYPKEFKGNIITPMAGASLVPTFTNHPLKPRALFWEHEMNKAVRMGKWKLVCTSEMFGGKSGRWKTYRSAPWELYDMDNDRTELHNLAAQEPDRVADMAKKWDVWAHASNVFPAPWKEEAKPALTPSQALPSSQALTPSPASPEIIHLWPGAVPGSTEAKHPARPAPIKGGIALLTDVTDPLITVYRPEPAKSQPAPATNRHIGIIISPGGGNKWLSDITEGEEVAKWFTARGFTAFVLQYRVPDQSAGALQDLQRALRVIRDKAGIWNLDPDKIGVMGFSAGGNLSARASTEFHRRTYPPVDKTDSLSARPDFAILVYPGGMANGPEHKLIPELPVDKNTSPTFLFVANDDPVGVPLSYAYALHDAKVPMELHVYPNGGHGFGLRRGNGVPWEWPPMAEKWVTDRYRTLKEIFKEDFKMGTAIGTDEINGLHPADTHLAQRQFNAVSSAVLEWSDINPQPGVYNFTTADRFVNLGEKNRMFVIAHGLIWHHLVPDWIFEDKDGHTTTRDTLLHRMRNYILTTVRRYKGRVNAWIVVNEALENNGQWRKTKWLEIIGKDYLQKAFEYAHAADPEAKLYYNDYDLWMPAKRAALIEWLRDCRSKGIRVDGIGIQGHWNLDYPSPGEVERTLKDFSNLGVKVMITEMDMSVLPRPAHHQGAEITDTAAQSKLLDPYTQHLPDSMQNKLAVRYGQFFALFHQFRKEIAAVNFWGINDRDSWRNDWPIKSRTDYPMLFDRADNPKPAFYAVINQSAQTDPPDRSVQSGQPLSTDDPYHRQPLSTARDTIYLDPLHASSNGNGRSPASPVRSLPDSLWGRPGMTILYKRGIVIRGEFSVFPGTHAAPVVIGAYGKGAKPLFIKSIDLDNAKYWVRENGNIWRCIKDLKATPCANIIYNHEAYCGAMRWQLQDLHQQGDWYMIDTVGGKFRFRDALYVYSKGNPAEVCDAIEYVPSGNFHTFGDNDSSIVVQDIHISNAGTHGFWFNGGHDITIRRCDISYIGGAVFTPRIGKNGKWVRYGNAIEIWKKGRYLAIEQCRVYENYDAGFVAQGSCGANCIDSVVVRNNIFFNNGFDNFDNSWGKEISRVYFENNTCVDAGAGWALQTEGRPRLSEFLPDTVGWHIFLDSFAIDRSTIWIRNNIFYNATANELLKVNKLPAKGWPNVHLDYNCYYQKNPKDALVQVVDAVFRADGFRQYQRSTGKDAHSIVANPLFVDPSRRDYRLLPNSPCIRAGVTTEGKVDFAGQPIPAGKAPDLGAFEYISRTGS